MKESELYMSHQRIRNNKHIAYRSLDEPIPISSRYFVTVRLAIGIPRACISCASSSSLSRLLGSSDEMSSRSISFTPSEPSKKSAKGIRRPLGSSRYLFAVARLTVPSSRFSREATSARGGGGESAPPALKNLVDS